MAKEEERRNIGRETARCWRRSIVEKRACLTCATLAHLFWLKDEMTWRRRNKTVNMRISENCKHEICSIIARKKKHNAGMRITIMCAAALRISAWHGGGSALRAARACAPRNILIRAEEALYSEKKEGAGENARRKRQMAKKSNNRGDSWRCAAAYHKTRQRWRAYLRAAKTRRWQHASNSMAYARKLAALPARCARKGGVAKTSRAI